MRAGLNEPEEGTALEIYVSTDVETDGPIPGVYSMLSIGSAAYLPDKTLHGGFSANLLGSSQELAARRATPQCPISRPVDYSSPIARL